MRTRFQHPRSVLSGNKPSSFTGPRAALWRCDSSRIADAIPGAHPAGALRAANSVPDRIVFPTNFPDTMPPRAVYRNTRPARLIKVYCGTAH